MNTSILPQNASLANQEWYSNLVEECKAIITEAIFTSRWALVEGYWNIGKLIREQYKTHKEIYGKKIAQDLAESIGISERTINYACAAYDKYPDLGQMPEGKNISWNKLVTKYLPAPKEKELPLPEAPKGKYNVIYADPPWDIGSMVLEKWESPLEDKYPTMTEEELKLLDIPSLSADDSVCFMWTTLSTLPEALRLLEAWGFKYHITLTWDKGGGWSANGFHRRTELVLFGYKGILSKVIKQEGEYIPTIFAEPKREHSAKPEVMYKFIENRTLGKKIELFARNKREGWDVWGNQI